MFSFLYEVLGGVIFMFYLHLLGFGKERFVSISNKIRKKSIKYRNQIMIIFLLAFLLYLLETINDSPIKNIKNFTKK